MSIEGDSLGLMNQMIGQYRVGRVVAQAASGLLYSGWDLTRMTSGSPTAVWLQFFDQKRSRRAELIRKQADAWRQFQHPAFVPILGCETSGSQALVAMDVGEGVLLSERLAAGPLNVVEATKLALLICEALVDAHQRRLANLGLSDESILLPKYERGGPRFFGVGLPMTVGRSDLNACHYLAPEQLMSQSDCDERADVYAVGVVMFRCLTGEYPIEVDGDSDRIAQLITKDRRDPRRWLGEAAEPLAPIIERCIQQDRSDRFQTSALLAGALRASGALLPEVAREKSDPKGIALTPPPARVPEQRATSEQHTLSPTPAPEVVAAVIASSDRRGPATAVAKAAPAPLADASLIGLQLKELRIETLLTEGGMSELYIARHVKLPRSWIIKVGSPELDAKAPKWFEQEAHVTAALKQRGERVAEVIDWDTLPDGRSYMVMEQIRGQSLDRVLAETPRLPIDDCLKIINRVCETLEHAHDAGFVHRDIKPANIMIEEKHGKRTNNVVVVDWGVARAPGEFKQKVTDVNTVVGTPGFMAPEGSIGQAVDGRGDVFSVATMLYEMLAGQAAFKGADPIKMIFSANNDHPPPLSSIRPEIHERLSEIVVAGMAKDRDKRPDMRTFRSMLHEYMEWLRNKRPLNAPSPLSTQLSTANPEANIPLARRATLAAINADQREIYHRIIEPEKTKPTRVKSPAPTRRWLPIGMAGILAAALIAIGCWLAFRHRQSVAPVEVASPASPANAEKAPPPQPAPPTVSPPAPAVVGSAAIANSPAAAPGRSDAPHPSPPRTGAIKPSPSRNRRAIRPAPTPDNTTTPPEPPPSNSDDNGLKPLSQ